jgi:hypothetical protein
LQSYFLIDVLHPATISTDVGDLLTSPRQRGKMYVNGRLLAEPTPVHPTDRAKKPLMFGYNIPSASLTADGCKSQAILIIWSHALVRKPELAAVLSTMLNSTDPQYADVAAAGKHMGFETAARLRRHLFGHGPHFEGKWYYWGERELATPGSTTSSWASAARASS